jgi:hypothetical protein
LVKKLDNAKDYAKGAKLYKGTTEVDPGYYEVEALGNTQARLTLGASFFLGSFQGSYTIQSETARNASKAITFTVINPVSVKLAATDGGTAVANGYDAASPLSVNAGDPLYFVGASPGDATAVSDFSKAIVVSGRGGLSTIEVVGGGTAPAIGDVVKRSGAAGTPYHIDTGALTSGSTYKLTLLATGFNNQVFYISVL